VSVAWQQSGNISASCCKGRVKVGRMIVSLMRWIKEIEDGDNQAKKIYAEERIGSEIRNESTDGKL